MTKKFSVMAVLVIMPLMVLAAVKAVAQDSAAAKPALETTEHHAYRVDFTLTEIDDGKKINTRQYSMNLNGGDEGEIKIGTRVPVRVKGDEFQYVDIGTNIWCHLRDRNSRYNDKEMSWLVNDVVLNVRSELSNFSIPDQQSQSDRPAIRQMKIDANTIAVVGKPTVIGVVDDPNSKRQFQLEVTVTKLR